MPQAKADATLEKQNSGMVGCEGNTRRFTEEPAYRLRSPTFAPKLSVQSLQRRPIRTRPKQYWWGRVRRHFSRNSPQWV